MHPLIVQIAVKYLAYNVEVDWNRGKGSHEVTIVKISSRPHIRPRRRAIHKNVVRINRIDSLESYIVRCIWLWWEIWINVWGLTQWICVETVPVYCINAAKVCVSVYCVCTYYGLPVSWPLFQSVYCCWAIRWKVAVTQLN